MTVHFKDPNEIAYKIPGVPTPKSASEMNTILRSVKKEIDIQRGEFNNTGYFVAKDPIYARTFMYVKTAEEIPARSVFTVETGDGFDPAYASGILKKINTDTPLIHLTNEEYEFGPDQYHFVPIIGMHKPHLVAYDSQATGTYEVGATVGVKNNEWVVSVDAEEERKTLVCASDPDTTNFLIWVVSLGGGGGKTCVKRGKPQATIPPLSDGTIILWDENGEISPQETEEVTNPHNIEFSTEEFVKSLCAYGWTKSVIEPWEYTECEEIDPTFSPVYT